MSRSSLIAVPVALGALILAACGGGGSSGHAGMDMGAASTTVAEKTGDEGLTAETKATPNRTVDVNMVDIAFEPKELTVKRGETVRFVFHNMGKVKHEAFFGDAESQNAHDQAMNATGASAQMEDMNDVEPSTSKTVDYTFDHSVIIGCHEPGHYAAGMKINVSVE